MDWLVVGLGNPGREYELTPHNVGFMVCDSLSSFFKFDFSLEKKFKGLLGEFRIKDNHIRVLKPLTYMNLSGESVYLALNFFKISLDNLVVIHDDLDLPLGRIRIKKNSSSGGHKGVQSIIDLVGSKDFIRVRIGVGREKDAARYVLSRFSEDKLEMLDRVILTSTDAVVDVIIKGLNYSMSKYNGLSMEV
ncbi:aminoacyl-tRNA hydrolase [Hippea alviniae]|uniref:aminoacyl-tRNA hydrolase n=1 Tax=Hippea alviniae TaxID=1279027 RepID=UPI0003B77677|nr:aminoacyl-tRNA hydrolase [Hippea alviniae]